MRRGGVDLAAGIAAVAGLAASFVGFGVSPRRALFGWLFGFGYWAGIAIASLVLLCAWHASRARWPVVIRRALEGMAGTMPVFAVLWLPLAIGARWLYPWANGAGEREEVLAMLLHQRAYMNLPAFVGRAAAYFAIWIAAAEALLRWSRRQDEEEGNALTRRQRVLGAGALPFVALSMSFAALDWLMAIEPRNTSSIFPLYWWTGSFLAAIALLAVWIATARGEGEPGELANASHRASLGKLLLGFTLFWLYIAFDQWLLVWIADLPREAHFYVVRTTGGWRAIAWTVVVAQFWVPFVALLSRRLKERPGTLAAIAAWILLAHLVDVWWLVVPAVDPAAPFLHWTDVSSAVGIGGLAVLVARLRLRGHPIARGDPYAEESLRYSGQ